MNPGDLALGIVDVATVAITDPLEFVMRWLAFLDGHVKAVDTHPPDLVGTRTAQRLGVEIAVPLPGPAGRDELGRPERYGAAGLATGGVIRTQPRRHRGSESMPALAKPEQRLVGPLAYAQGGTLWIEGRVQLRGQLGRDVRNSLAGLARRAVTGGAGAVTDR